MTPVQRQERPFRGLASNSPFLFVDARRPSQIASTFSSPINLRSAFHPRLTYATDLSPINKSRSTAASSTYVDCEGALAFVAPPVALGISPRRGSLLFTRPERRPFANTSTCVHSNAIAASENAASSALFALVHRPPARPRDRTLRPGHARSPTTSPRSHAWRRTRSRVARASSVRARPPSLAVARRARRESPIDDHSLGVGDATSTRLSPLSRASCPTPTSRTRARTTRMTHRVVDRARASKRARARCSRGSIGREIPRCFWR